MDVSFRKNRVARLPFPIAFIILFSLLSIYFLPGSADSPDANHSNFWDAGCKDANGDPKQRNHVINYAGPFATLRTDDMEFDFKNLSVREIQTP